MNNNEKNTDIYAARAKEIIRDIMYINLATTDGNNVPWNTPLYYGYDKSYTLYWASWTENQHSHNIARNPRAFVTIYDTRAPEGSGEGVYMQGTARMLTDEQEIQRAIDVSYARKNKKPRVVADFVTPSVRRMYAFTPESVWVNIDDFSLPIDKRVKVEITL